MTKPMTADTTDVAADALRASEDRFGAAFYASPVAMAITTLAEGRYVDVNEAFERQMGYERAEICGRTSTELRVWPTDADRAAMIAALHGNKQLRDQPQQFRTKSGALITTRYSAGLISLDDVPCVLAAIVDVTAQTIAEDALRESEAKFRMLTEMTQSGIFIYQGRGLMCYVNPEMERSTEYTADELCTMSVWDLVHPEFCEAVRARSEARLRGETVPARYELPIITKSGQVRWLDLSARMIEFDGRPAVLGSGFDITNNKRAAQQAREHTALLQALVANSPYGILVGGKDHLIQFCNVAFERIFQYSADEVVGRDPDDLIGVPETTEAADYSARVLRGEVVHATAVRRRKDGSLVDVEFHAVPLMSDGQFIGCFGIYQDISERIQSEARLRALRDRLTRVQDEERAHIARELHDDIGQRLALLAIQLAQLQKEAGAAAPALDEAFDAARRLAEEVCADAQRISHRLHPSQLALLSLATALAGLCERFAAATGAEIEFVPDDIPRLPRDVSTCLFRIAQEAIQNALKHSQGRRIRVELTKLPDVIRLRVSDDGCGFDPVSVEHGPGLGLVSIMERARSVGGHVVIDAAFGRGTRIDVTVPVTEPPRDQR